MTTPLDKSIELFASGHAEDLTPAEQWTLGKAAGIVSRIHAGITDDGPPMTPARAAVLADRPAP